MINAPEFPVKLPKFAAHFFITTPIENLIENFKLWIDSPNKQELVRAEASMGAMDVSFFEDAKRFTLGITLVVSPLDLTEEGYLEAWIEIDGEIERAGRLKIRLNTAQNP